MKSILAVLLPSFLLAGCSQSLSARQVVLPSEKAFGLSAADLSALGATIPTPLNESWSKGGTGGSSTLEYNGLEYNGLPPSAENLSFAMHFGLGDHNTPKNATWVLQVASDWADFTVKAGKLSQTPMRGQTRYGEASSLWILKKGTANVGNVFLARAGGRTFSLLLVGHSFRDPKQWDAFAGKKIRAWLGGTARLAPPTWTYD